MKALSLILKILIIIATCIWGVACGILFPVVILASGGEIVSADIASHHVIPVWLVVSIIGYVLPAAFILCRRYKLAAVFSVVGLGGILYVFTQFASIYAYTPDSNGPTELYLPCIFITIAVIALAVINNTDLIKEKLEKRSERLNAAAPSILGDNEKEE